MEYSIEQLIKDAVEKYDDKYKNTYPDKAQWIVSDSLFVLLNGIQRKEVKKYISFKSSEKKSSEKPIPVFGENVYLSIEDALFVFGTAIVSDELDEGNQFAKGHPAAHVFPAALVTAIERNSDYEEFIRAFVIGYEVSARLGYAASMPDNMHPHGTWGLIGGTLAVALLKKKPIDQIINACLIACSIPIVTSWEAAITGKNVRNIYCGLSNLNSYQSVQYEECGFESSLEVANNVWGQLVSSDFDSGKLKENLFSPLLLEKNYFKFYPSCRFTHSAIDALEKVMKSQKMNVEHIKQIKVETYSLAARCKIQNPQNYLAAKFSIPYILSLLLNKVPIYEGFEEEYLFNESILNVAGKIEVEENSHFTSLLPVKRASKISIYLSDGKKFSEVVEVAKGEYSLGFPKEELTKKFEQILKINYKHLKHSDLESTISTVISPEMGPVNTWVSKINRRLNHGN